MSETGTAEPTATGSDTVAINGDDLTALIEQGSFQGEAEENVEETEQSEPEAESPAAEEEQESEPDQIDDFLAGLTDEQKMDLASKLGGRLGPELGKMRAEIRELKAVNQTEAEKRSPFEKEDSTPNPYAAETDLKSLKETYDSAGVVIKDGEKLLRRYRNADADDEVEFAGRTYTVASLEDLVDEAREAYSNHIPKRVDELRASEGMETTRLQNFEKVKEIHPWLGEEGEMKNAFETVRDKYLPSVRDHIPDILPYFDQMLADHLSMASQRINPPKKETGQAAAERPRAKKPPGNPGGSAAASARPVPSDAKKNKFLEDFTSAGQSMSGSDLDAYLAAK